MTVTQQLCQRIAGMSAKDIGEPAIAAARRLVLDGLAVAVAGAALERAPVVLGEYFREQGGRPEASVIGQGFRLPAAQAALVNGAAMHVLDFEPMWLPSTHALSPALSAALALAETHEATGDDVAAAVVKGIELQMTILEGGGHVESRNMRFHPPGMVGPLGAVVAAAHILRLDAQPLAHAIGIVTSRCGSLFSNIGTMTKASHCGYAAAFGVEAALLAARGFTGSTEAFDASQGYVQAFLSPEFDTNRLLRFAEPFKLLEPGFAIKLFPCKFTTHYAVTAGLAAKARIASSDRIEQVRMLAAAVPSADRPRPQTGLEGKFSVQYTAAAALLDGKVDFDTFTDERLHRSDMQALLPRIELAMSTDISTRYTAGRYLEMEVQLTDGSLIKERCDIPRGAWGAAPVTVEEHLVKVRNCLATKLGSDDAETVIRLAGGLDELTGPDVRRLVALCRGPGNQTEMRQ